MIPISDTHPTRSFPFVNWLIIVSNIIIFYFQITASEPQSIIKQFGFIPQNFDVFTPHSYVQVFTSMWLHGGFLHIISNLWFLHIFGDNVEDAVGHFRYLIFYIITGSTAVFIQYLFSTQSIIPMIGASGAIAGVTGMYFVLFKGARIKALIPSFFGLWHIIELPAWFFLGYWFVLQVFSGVGSLAITNSQAGGVAFFAHIGGFLGGLLIAKVFYTFDI